MNAGFESRRRTSWTAAVIALVMLVFTGPAQADNVDKLIKDLSSASDYKLRLTALSSLVKLGDKRAIPALINALDPKKEPEKTVRGAAAVGLGKVVTSATPADLKKKAMDALNASTKKKKEKDSFVRKQAKKAYTKLKKLKDEETDVPVSSGGIYVDIGSMSSKTGKDDDKMKEMMRKTVKNAFKKNASDMTVGEGSASKGKVGYHVDGTLNEVTETVKSGQVIISCKVSGLVAWYRGDRNPPEKSIFGNLSGGAKVTASDDEKDKAAAAADCVAAVLEDLVIKKIIPTIKVKAAEP